MSQDLAEPGGTQLFSLNQRVDSGKLNSIGTMGEQGLYDGVVAGLFNGRDGFIGDGCRPSKGAGDLDWLVEPGMGVITLAGATSKEPSTTPIFVDVQQSGTFAAHDVTNPRIDIVSLAPLSVDDEEEVVQILSGGSSLDPDDKFTRRRRAFQLTVTAGTPAPGPSAPATPAGHLLVGQFSIPATAGPIISVADSRQLTGLASEADQNRPWKVEPQSITAKAANARTVSVTIKGLEGGTRDAPEGWPADNNQRYYMEATVYDDDHVIDTTLYQITAGPNETTAFKSRVLFKVAAGTSSFTITVTDITTAYLGTLYLHLKPILFYEETAPNVFAERSKGGVPVVIPLDWS